MTEMTDKEKQIQIALGTLDIPELIPIDLHKVNKDNTHPDLKEEEGYLVHVYGVYRIGFIESDDGTFCVGNYEQCINDCDAIWLIKENVDVG